MGSEWIKHDGERCPDDVVYAASKGYSVELQFYEAEGETTKDPLSNDWVHRASRWDIVAYRIVETASEQKQEPPPEKMGVLWTSHNGGPCPDEVVFAYRNRQRVTLLFREPGRTEIMRCFPRCYRWRRRGLPMDIMGYSIETAGEQKQESKPMNPMASSAPIPDGWRALQLNEVVEQFDVIWNAEKRRGTPVLAWGYQYKNVNGGLIIRQLLSCYHRGCGSVDVGVDR